MSQERRVNINDSLDPAKRWVEGTGNFMAEFILCIQFESSYELKNENFEAKCKCSYVEYIQTYLSFALFSVQNIHTYSADA